MLLVGGKSIVLDIKYFNFVSLVWEIKQRVKLCDFVVLRITLVKQNNTILKYLTIITSLRDRELCGRVQWRP